jgi:protein SCO1/2
VLKAYAEKFGVGPGWQFLTGTEADIKLVIKKLGLSSRNDNASRDGHAASLMLGNEPAGQWMRNSAIDNPRFLARKITDMAGLRDQERGKSYAGATKLSVEDQGKYLFANRCGACHSIGQGDKIGPDLLNVTTRRDRAWLVRYLAEPETVLAEGDPIASVLFVKYQNVRMPNLKLDREDIALILSYLDAQAVATREQAKGESVDSSNVRPRR